MIQRPISSPYSSDGASLSTFHILYISPTRWSHRQMINVSIDVLSRMVRLRDEVIHATDLALQIIIASNYFFFMLD